MILFLIIFGIYNISKAENVSDLQAQKAQIKQELQSATQSLEDVK